MYDYVTALKKAKATAADVKFVEKYIAPKMVDVEYQVIENPFTGWEMGVDPLLYALVKFTQQLIYSDFSPRALAHWGVPPGQKIQLFDRAKYIVLKLNRNVYSAVID